MVGQRFDREVDDLDAILKFDADAGAAGRAAGLDGLGQRGAQIEAQSAAGHRHDVAARRSGRAFQILAGAVREVHDVAVARHDDMSRGELLDDPVFDDVPQRQRRVISDRRPRLHQAAPAGRYQERQPGVNPR